MLVLLGACSTTAQQGSPTIEGEVTLLYGEVHLHHVRRGWIGGEGDLLAGAIRMNHEPELALLGGRQ